MSEQNTISTFYEQDHDRLDALDQVTSEEERKMVFRNMNNILEDQYKLGC